MAFSNNSLDVALYFYLGSTRLLVKDNSDYAGAVPSIDPANIAGCYKLTDPNGNILHENTDFDNPDISPSITINSSYVTFTETDGDYTLVYSAYDSSTHTTYTKTFTFTYAESDIPEIAIDIESDIGLATIESNDITEYSSNITLSSRSHILTYPASWGSSVTSNAEIALTYLYTGKYSCSITSAIIVKGSVTEDLVIYTTITGTQTHDVWSSDGVYVLRTALRTLFERWQASETPNPKEWRRLGLIYNQVNSNYTLFNSAKQNGDIEDAGEFLNNIKVLLNAESIDTEIDPSVSVPVIASLPGYATQWLDGDGLPANTLGRDGDYYYRIDSGRVYKKSSGAWSDIGAISNSNISTDGNTIKLYDEKIRLNSVQAYGAIGDGVTDDTSAIQSAFNASSNVYFPSGIYVMSNITIANENTHIYGDGSSSVLSFKSGSTGVMINGGTKSVVVENIRFSGGAAIDYKTITSSPTDRSGLSISSSKNSIISSITIDGFENIGLLINDTATPSLWDKIRVVNSLFKENYIGIETGLDGENYTVYTGLIIRYCRYGFIAGQGNVNLTNSNIYKNYYAIYLDGSRPNNGHGIISNCLLNHNSYVFYATQVLTGYTFVGNQMFEGIIHLDNCEGINISDGAIDVDEFELTDNGLNWIINNHSRTHWLNTITKTSDNTLFLHNYLDDGTYLEGRIANGIYSSKATAGVRTGFGIESPIFNVEAQSEGNSTASYVVRNSLKNLICFAYEESGGDGGYRINDKDGNTKIKFSSNGDSYFIGGGVAIGTYPVNSSAALHISSTTGALLIPRMSTTQRDALTPLNGMIIYNSTTNAFNFYENGSWVAKLDA